MIYQRTIKIPIHYLTTKKKLSYLDNLTAKLTYAVRLWSKIIDEHDLKSLSDCSLYEKQIQQKTKLSLAFVQQARDKALWMYKQYKEQHQKWEWLLSKAKGKWYHKLKKREPSKPCTSKRSRLKKIPTRFDYRTGKIEKANLKLTKWVIRISTLRNMKLLPFY